MATKPNFVEGYKLLTAPLTEADLGTPLQLGTAGLNGAKLYSASIVLTRLVLTQPAPTNIDNLFVPELKLGINGLMVPCVQLAGGVITEGYVGTQGTTEPRTLLTGPNQTLGENVSTDPSNTDSRFYYYDSGHAYPDRSIVRTKDAGNALHEDDIFYYKIPPEVAIYLTTISPAIIAELDAIITVELTSF